MLGATSRLRSRPPPARTNSNISAAGTIDSAVSSHNDETIDITAEDLPRIVRHLHNYIRKLRWNKLHKALLILRDHGTATDIRSGLTRCNKLGETPLHAVADHAPSSLIMAMFDLIPQDEVSDYLLIVDNKGNTPLHCLCRNFVLLSDVNIVLVMTSTCPEALSIRNQQGDTPLHLFVQSKGYQEPEDALAVETARLKLQSWSSPLGIFGNAPLNISQRRVNN